ncbi:MAG: hypothetical protein JWP87_3513 [Labilithrix sp.]|nr:hypothetical protein [Labilithrix sp.]
MASKTKAKSKTKLPAYRLRRSPVHGTGVFATRTIRKGEELIEYAGERITHEEADRRHADKAEDDGHTFLFTIDAKTVVDAGVDGNDARFINHSCDPNCEVVISDGRLLVETIKTVKAGEELAYDYNLTRGLDDDPEIEKVFACRCGAANCRGTMLQPPKKKKQPKASGKTQAKSHAKPAAKRGSGRKKRAA